MKILYRLTCDIRNLSSYAKLSIGTFILLSNYYLKETIQSEYFAIQFFLVKYPW